jgi:protease-4
MSDAPVPALPPARPPAPPRAAGLGIPLFFSCLFNFVLLGVVCVGCLGYLFFGSSGSSTDQALAEKFHSGNTGAKDKIAIVHIDGPLLEGFLNYPHKEIEASAKDKSVKAVVLRINSPGGSITASDDLHRRLVELRDGNPRKNLSGKPLVVSMASLAASGGYYISMPARVLVAERTTLTGSIGVFAAFPNFAEMGRKYGFKMETIKAGAVKDAGSMFKEMTPQERQVWQDMVNNAYAQFQAVVEEGRPDLKGKLEEKVFAREIEVKDADGKVTKEPYSRYRADGGIFTAEQAKQLGLIDKIGYLDDAVKEAAQVAGLSEEYRAVTYERPKSLTSLLLGLHNQPPSVLDPARLAEGLTPRLWYLAPRSELAGILAAMEQ